MDGRRPAPRAVWTWLALGVLIAGFVAHAAVYGAYIDDDAGITFGYARSWVEGRGLTVNPADPPVEGYSNPTWTFLLALTMKLGLFHWTWTPKLLGGACGALTLGLSALAAARLSARRLEPLHLLAPALLAVNGSFVVWAVSGLENGLYGALVLGALVGWLGMREAPKPAFGLVLAAVALTRPEAVGYTGLLLADAALGALLVPARRRATLGLFGVAFGTLAVYAAWHAATFADPLPNTYYAKVKGEEGSTWARATTLSSAGWRYLGKGFANWNLGWTVPAALLLAARPGRHARGVPLAWALAAWGPFFVVTTGGDWMMEYRFLSPTYALFAALAAGGVVVARDAVAGAGVGWAGGRVPARAAQAAAAVVALAGFAYAAVPLPARAAAIAASPTMPLKNTRRVADLFVELGQRLAAVPPVVVQGAMGGPALESRGRVVWIDAFGLTDRTVAHCFHVHCPREELWRYAFEERAADFLDFPPAMARGWRLVESPAFQADFVPMRGAKAGVGGYVRRSRLLAPAAAAEAASASPPVRSGNVDVYALTTAPAVDGEPARLVVDFAVTGKEIPAAFLVGSGGRAVRLPLLEFVDPHALTPGTRYRDRPQLPAGATAVLVPADAAADATATPGGGAPDEAAVEVDPGAPEP